MLNISLKFFEVTDEKLFICEIGYSFITPSSHIIFIIFTSNFENKKFFVTLNLYEKGSIIMPC